MMSILDAIGVVTCLTIIIVGVLLSATKSLFWTLVLLALLVLAVFVSFLRVHLQSVKIGSDSLNTPHDLTQE